MSLLTTKFVKNSHIYVRIFLSFWKTSLNKFEIFLLPNLNHPEKIGKAVTK